MFFAFKPEMEFNMMNIMYVALRMCTHTEKMTVLCKDESKRIKLKKYANAGNAYSVCTIPPLLHFSSTSQKDQQKDQM